MVRFVCIPKPETLFVAGTRVMAMPARAWDWAAIFAGETE